MKIDKSGKATLQISVNINGPMLEVEKRIQQALNEAGYELTGKALAQFDTDGSPVMTGSIKWTRRCMNTKTYQTLHGGRCSNSEQCNAALRQDDRQQIRPSECSSSRC